MKKFILGFISGGIICAAVTGFAVEYAVTANPFPVTVNGSETAIEGYNINDSTYFKLRDVADAVGGFSVGFEDNTIVLTTTATEATPTPAPTPLPTASTSEPLPDVAIQTIDGVNYVDKLDVENMLDDIGLGDYQFSSKHFYNVNDLAHPLLDDVPHPSDTNLLIPYDYYISTVVPIINSLR